MPKSENNEPAKDESRKMWVDPVCAEISVEDVTAAGGPGVTDSGFLS